MKVEIKKEFSTTTLNARYFIYVDGACKGVEDFEADALAQVKEVKAKYLENFHEPELIFSEEF